MRNYIEAYLKDQETAWSPTTLRSETSRLKHLADKLDMEPHALFQHLQAEGHKKYSIKTMFIRICNLEAWCLDHGYVQDATFKAYMDRHKNRFKHVYQREELNITFEEALERIQKMDEIPRQMAMDIIKTGLRLDESYKVEDGKVEGKGGKFRKVFGTIGKTVPKSTFYRHLARVGLKPHTLRKLCATRLADKGASLADLMKFFGWSSVNTAQIYLLGKDNERMQSFADEALKG